MKSQLAYKDVYLLPQKTVVHSRRECDTSVNFGGFRFDMPILPANMRSVINEQTCEYFARKNWFYTMHRFDVDTVAFAKHMRGNGLIVSVSTGIDLSDLESLKAIGISPEYITIDIANAWSIQVQESIGKIKSIHPKSFLIVGNVATYDATVDLQSWGADAVKVGIAGGKVCITRDKTGFHRPMVSTVLDCSVANIPIIADGGVQTHGDIAKAIACGATMVMAGSLFAGYDESAGDIVEINGREYKEYFGSASEFNKKQRKNIEGKKILVDYKGPMDPLIAELKEDLQSSISYAGGKDLSALHQGLLIKVE